MTRKPPVKLNLLDRVIAQISPATAERRARARLGLQILAGYGGYPVQRTAGKKSGTLFNWITSRNTRYTEGLEREEIQDRAEDLVANDPHATSTIESMSLNVVGTGLKPQSKPRYKQLGITEEQAAAFAEQAEWAFAKWSRYADAARKGHFEDLQYQAIYSMLMSGEFLCLPLMDRFNGAGLKLELQMLEPQRLMTPTNLLSDPVVRDGIRLGAKGEPLTYYIANPDDGVITTALNSSYFKSYPAWRGHRPVVIHQFYQRKPEQVRGVSVLAPAMKFFKDLSDYLDFELVGAIMAASFSVWVDTSNPYDITNGMPNVDSTVDPDKLAAKYTEVEPGKFVFGPGKPTMLESHRPSNTFEGFIQTILRAVGAAAGLPYEVVSKDFSKTNYSSARAALLEAWRVFMLYRRWLERHFCHEIWMMVLEEAILRGQVVLPKNAPGFYEAREEWCQATWIGPAKGHVDPLKEMNAYILGKANHILTQAQVNAEQGGDWEADYEQAAREKRKREELGLEQLAPVQTVEEKPDADEENN